jgi:hypothetical protein
MIRWIVFIGLLAFLTVWQYGDIARIGGIRCTLGVTGTAATITIDAVRASEWCQGQLRSDPGYYQASEEPNNPPLICEYRQGVTRFRVHDEVARNLVGSRICQALQNATSVHGPSGLTSLTAIPATLPPLVQPANVSVESSQQAPLAPPRPTPEIVPVETPQQAPSVLPRPTPQVIGFDLYNDGHPRTSEVDWEQSCASVSGYVILTGQDQQLRFLVVGPDGRSRIDQTITKNREDIQFKMDAPGVYVFSFQNTTYKSDRIGDASFATTMEHVTFVVDQEKWC